VGGVPYSVAIGDFNGDGKPDLAVASGNGVSILINNTTPLPGPDLVMKMVLVRGHDRVDMDRGHTIIITNIVENQGTVGTGSTPFRVGLYLSKDSTITTSDIFLNSRSVGPLAPGAVSQANTRVRIPRGLAPGTYFIGAIADDTNKISETNELNNAKAGNTINLR